MVGYYIICDLMMTGVLITSSISQAERMLAVVVVLALFMRNGWVSEAPRTLNGTNLSECINSVYLGQEMSMKNGSITELRKEKRTAWGVPRIRTRTHWRNHRTSCSILTCLTPPHFLL
ncbi:hypothetical protein RB195_025195 [Necator americanus]|uniref:Secreted protein n=1 Tax=Necator americanus TaxID=51031 RepID=A0ABR1ERA3_NECAM